MNSYDIPVELTQVLKKRDSFLLIGHKDPDGDCLSSQLAFGSFLERIGKKVCLLSPGPFDRAEIEHQEKYFHPHVPDDWKDIDPLVVVLDCSTLDRIGHLADEIKYFTVAVVDHHDSGMSFGDIQFIRPEAPSVTFMIHKIIESFDMVPSPREAEHLLFGIATDTGFFRHLESGSQELFMSVAELTKYGASPKDVYSEMYGGRTLKSRQLMGRLLSRSRSELDGKLMITYETEEDFLEFGTTSRDSDSLYQQLQGIKNVEAIILIRFESGNELSVGLRSKHYADIGAVAKSFGGGGHKRAAGFSWNGSAEEITDKLLEVFRRIL